MYENLRIQAVIERPGLKYYLVWEESELLWRIPKTATFYALEQKSLKGIQIFQSNLQHVFW